jgi:hypothetical protein
VCGCGWKLALVHDFLFLICTVVQGSPLHKACFAGSAEVATLLLDAGVTCCVVKQ